MSEAYLIFVTAAGCALLVWLATLSMPVAAGTFAVVFMLCCMARLFISAGGAS